MYSYFVTAFSCLKQLEKAEKQALLLEQSAKELSERQEREKQLQKLIEEKEVWSVKILSYNNEYYNMYTYLRLLFLSDCMG